MVKIPDITLIGGGITGLLSARLFSIAGAKVTLIDQGFIGQESSWAGGGILLPLYPWRQPAAISELVSRSITTYSGLSDELFAETGIDPEYRISGLLMTQLDDLTDAKQWCQSYSIPYQAATVEQLKTYPQAKQKSLWLPTIAQARNPRLLQSLKQDLLKRGVNMVENCKIESAAIKANKITEIASQSQRFSVQQLVITSGAWSANLWQQLLNNQLKKPNIFPVKGQMIILETAPNTIKEMILEKDHYLIPRRDGKVLCGSSVEDGGFDKSVTEVEKNNLASFARELCPSILSNAPIIHHWAGLRPGTQSGIPYIDKHPEIHNLAINAGHFRNGFAMGPAAAQLLVDLITQQKTDLDPSLYALDATH
ncbi:MAG: FAD-dependent oxidoreductase [Methyloprofundus sp.]|nr:FAD-dependent oxidoreductase [Methyloprofundus sp.]